MTVKISARIALIVAMLCQVTVAAERQYDFDREVLDNGLTVISLEDHSCPVVAVHVWYHVGSKNEDPNRQGFAHMFEHMMFRGTDAIGPEDHSNIVRGIGGNCNAGTIFDYTSYINKVPSNQLELAMWLEAERMAFLKVDEQGFHTERKVVEEERRQLSLNAAYGTVLEKLMAELFSEHPYRWTPIGNIPHLRAATIDELQAFWDRFYVPSNATLVVVGDTDHKTVMELAKKYFGWIPRMPKPEQVSIVEPLPTKPRRIVIDEDKGPLPVVGLVYPGVASGHEDELALEMLMSIMGSGESSRIYRDLVKERKMCQMALGAAGSLEDAGLLGAGAMMLPFSNQQGVVDAIREHFSKVAAEGVTEREVQKAKNNFLRDEVTQSLTVMDKATLLGQCQTINGDAEQANLALDRIRAITREDLNRVAKKYLVKERELLVMVKPKAGGLGALFGGKKGVDEGAEQVEAPTTNRVAARGGARANLKRPAHFPSTPPTAELLESFPDMRTFERKLRNGLRVVVLENHETPYVTMKLGILNGAWTESKPGAASLAASMITQGTKQHTGAELADELDYHAVAIGGSASMDVASVDASCVSDKLPVMTKYFAEVVREPAFPAEEFAVSRQQLVAGLMVQETSPAYMANNEMRKRLYGSHPYGRPTSGAVKDIQALTVEDLRNWWSAFVRPEDAVLYVAGDVDPERVVALINKHFGDWSVDTPKPKIELPAVPKLAPTQIYLVDKPGAAQSEIRIAHASITRDHKDFVPAILLGDILGGSFESRLNNAVRVKRGLTYGATGGFTTRRFAGEFAASTNTKTPKTAEAVQVVLDEIARTQNEPFGAEEFQVCQAYTVGSFAGKRETPQSLVADLWVSEYDDLGDDFFRKYLEKVKKTTPEDLSRTAKKLIHTDQLIIVVVGEAEAIKDDLEKIAPVTAMKPDGRPIS